MAKVQVKDVSKVRNRQKYILLGLTEFSGYFLGLGFFCLFGIFSACYTVGSLSKGKTSHFDSNLNFCCFITRLALAQ